MSVLLPIRWDRRFLTLADLVASWSKDPSTKTGAVIVRPDRTIASVGYNGFPRGMRDDLALLKDREVKYSRTVHCEMNAILSARERLDGYSLYVMPFMTCDRCAVHVIQAGIRRVITVTATNDQLSRWGSSFERTRSYYEEAGVDVLEYDPDVVRR